MRDIKIGRRHRHRFVNVNNPVMKLHLFSAGSNRGIWFLGVYNCDIHLLELRMVMRVRF